uniref:Uncharacterized protein n=1 Tax=Noctiluca scintillans TaxID=2966 RepID=A0A7S0ZZV7_NOCSC|mmetsp:Transcript_2504/g.7406  ORF Transcript_2504/g.7406 Transcript_2504/m.7406 type:complete len:570 (+) Transcript_2504:38-1747(+)
MGSVGQMADASVSDGQTLGKCCRVWLPDSVLPAGKDLHAAIEGDNRINFTHLRRKFPHVKFRLSGEASLSLPPWKRLQVVAICENPYDLEPVAVEVIDLAETACDIVSEKLGMGVEQVQDAFEAIRVEKHDTKLAAPMADPAASATAVLAAASVATAAAFAGRSTVSGLVGKAGARVLAAPPGATTKAAPPPAPTSLPAPVPVACPQPPPIGTQATTSVAASHGASTVPSAVIVIGDDPPGDAKRLRAAKSADAQTTGSASCGLVGLLQAADAANLDPVRVASQKQKSMTATKSAPPAPRSGTKPVEVPLTAAGNGSEGVSTSAACKVSDAQVRDNGNGVAGRTAPKDAVDVEKLPVVAPETDMPPPPSGRKRDNGVPETTPYSRRKRAKTGKLAPEEPTALETEPPAPREESDSSSQSSGSSSDSDFGLSSTSEEELPESKVSLAGAKLYKLGEPVCGVIASWVAGSQEPSPLAQRLDIDLRVTLDRCRDHAASFTDRTTVWRLSVAGRKGKARYAALSDYFTAKRRVGLAETPSYAVYIVPPDTAYLKELGLPMTKYILGLQVPWAD